MGIITAFIALFFSSCFRFLLFMISEDIYSCLKFEDYIRNRHVTWKNFLLEKGLSGLFMNEEFADMETEWQANFFEFNHRGCETFLKTIKDHTAMWQGIKVLAFSCNLSSFLFLVFVLYRTLPRQPTPVIDAPPSPVITPVPRRNPYRKCRDKGEN